MEQPFKAVSLTKDSNDINVDSNHHHQHHHQHHHHHHYH